MPIATDIIHTEQLVDAAITLLKTELPSDWFNAAKAEYLRLVLFGDAREYAVREETTDKDTSIIKELPALLVRPIQVTPAAEYDGVGGQAGTADRLRIVMIRTRDQAYTSTGALTTIPRAKARYMKIISEAIRTGGRLGLPTLTCASGSAAVMKIEFVSADYSEGTPDTRAVAEMGNGCWAIALDVSVVVSSVG
jgi:hypothetical protein